MQNFILTVKTAPTTEPVTLATVKKHLRLDEADTTEDALLENLIKAAREFCEAKQGRAYCLTDFTGTLDNVPFCEALSKAEVVKIPILPINKVNSVKIIQTDGITSTLFTVPASEYDVDKRRGLFKLNHRHRPSAYDTEKLSGFSGFIIDFTAGLDTENQTTPEIMPARTIQAMLLIIGHWFEHREDATDGFEVRTVPTAADALLQQERTY